MEHPLVLTIAHLRKAGLLASDRKQAILDVGSPILIEKERKDTFSVTVPKYSLHESESKLFNISALFARHTIEIRWRDLNFGPRAFFICPQTGDYCLKLVFYNGLVSSISAFKLIKADARIGRRAIVHEARRQRFLKRDGSLRIRRDEQDELLERLIKHPRQLQHDVEILEFLERRDRAKNKRQARFQWESRPLSTTKLLDNGRGAGQENVYFEFLERDEGWIETIEVPDLGPPAERGRPEDYPVLDIRVLLDRGWFRDTEFVTCLRVGWPPDLTGGKIMYMFTGGRGELPPRLVFRFEDVVYRAVTWQVVETIRSATSKRPRYFICPYTRARTETLFLRNGAFASSQVHRIGWRAS